MLENNIDLDDLNIDTSSVYALEVELTHSARQIADFEGVLSKAIKEVDLATMNYEITVAEVTDEICRNENVATYGRPEVRKSKTPLDKRWQLARTRLIDAVSVKNDIQAAVNGINTKRFRLSELFKLKQRELWQNPEEMEDTKKIPRRNLNKELESADGMLELE